MAASSALIRTPPSILGALPRTVVQAPIGQTLLPDVSHFAPAVRRLVILIPHADTDETKLSQRLWSMAAQHELPVLLLGLSHEASHEPRLRRRLATLAALTRDAKVHVETKVVIGRDWIQAVRSVHRLSDRVICHAEQRLIRRGLRYESLSQLLMLAFNQPVTVLVGFYPNLPPDNIGLFSRLLSIAIPLTLFAACTGLQILIHLNTTGTPYTLLMSISVIVEYGLLGLWHYLFN